MLAQGPYCSRNSQYTGRCLTCQVHSDIRAGTLEVPSSVFHLGVPKHACQAILAVL